MGRGEGIMNQMKGFYKLDEVDFVHWMDDKDSIIFDQEIMIYHEKVSEKRRINVDYYTRIISK